MLVDLLKFYKVNVLVNTSLLEVTDEGAVVINKSFNKSMLTTDNIVLSVGLQSDRKTYRSLTGKIPNMYLIGDAKQAQNIMCAIWDAYEIGRNI